MYSPLLDSASLLDQLDVAVALIDDDMRIVHANVAAERILGVSRRAMIGVSMLDVPWRMLGPDGRAYAREQHPVLVALRTRRPVPDVVLGVQRGDDGHLVWVSVSARPVADIGSSARDGGEARRGVIATFRDVTEELLAERAFALVHDLVRGIGEAADLDEALRLVLARLCESTRWSYGEVWLRRAGAHRLERAGVWHEHAGDAPSDVADDVRERVAAFAAASGASAGEEMAARAWNAARPVLVDGLLDDPADDLADARDVEPALSRRDALVAAGFSTVLAVPVRTAGEVVAVLVFFRLEAQARREARRRVSRREMRPPQLIEAVAGHLGALIERRRAADALRESEARFRAASEGGLDAQFFFRSVRGDDGGIADFEIVDCNTRAAMLIGMPREDVLGHGLCELFPDVRIGGGLALYARVVETRESFDLEAESTDPRIAARWLRVQALPLGDGLAVTMRDITEDQDAADALRRANEVLRAVTDAIPDAIYLKDRDGRYVMANPAAAAMLGGNPADVLGQRADELFPLDAFDAARDADAGVLADGEPRAFELTTTIDGRPRTLAALKVPVRDAAAHVFGVLGVLRDVTVERASEHDREARRRAEAAERHFRRLAEAIPQIVWTANPDGWLDYYNARWFDYTGLTLEESQGWGWEPVLHADDARQCIARWTEACRTGDPYEVEYRLRRASDGAYRWHLGRALPVRDESGAIVKWFGTCTDIHDQRQAADAMREWEIVFRHSSWGVLVADEASASITAANPAFERMHGYDAGELIGRSIIDTLAPEAREEFSAHATLLAAVGHVAYETTGIRKDGSRFPVLIDATTVTDASGTVRSRIANYLDLTESQAAEAERHAAEERFREVQDASPDAFLLWDVIVDARGRLADATLAYVNPAARRTLGLSELATPGRRMSELFPTLYESGRFAIYADVLATGRTAELEIHYDAMNRRLRLVVMKVGDGLGVVATDITAIREAEAVMRRSHAELEALVDARTRELQASEARFRHLFEDSGAMQWLLDRETLAIVDVNEAACRFYGYAADVMRGMSVHDISTLSAAERAELAVRVRAGESASVTPHRLASGEMRQVEFHPTTLVVQGRALVHSILIDVTDRRHAEEELRALSLTDPLTGLYNRRGFFTLGEQQLKLAERARTPVMLLYLDLDAFKPINDTHGHAEGDRVLHRVADAMRATFRHTDVLGRLGGDEFVALATGEPGAANDIIRRLHARLAEDALDASAPYRVELSMGSARFDPAHPTSLQSLLEMADHALYAMKREKQEGR